MYNNTKKIVKNSQKLTTETITRTSNLLNPVLMICLMTT